MANPLAQQIVAPAEIESTLQSIWDALAQENKTRASLFNLIVYSCLSSRTDYMRQIVQRVIERFPCRILFVSFDPDPSTPYLKTAVSVISSQLSASTACDQIDVGVAGQDLERVPFLLLPHLLPDLPTVLLWAEDPSCPSPLFDPLSSFASRLIFDSESTDTLPAFAKKVLDLSRKFDVADLNWARTERWRDMIASSLSSNEKMKEFQNTKHLHIIYNSHSSEYFSHLSIQATYLASWLKSRFGWKKIDLETSCECWDDINPGILLSLEMRTQEESLFQCIRQKKQPQQVLMHLSSANQCDLPCQFIIPPSAVGQSLVKEICNKGTSQHFLQMLQTLLNS